MELLRSLLRLFGFGSTESSPANHGESLDCSLKRSNTTNSNSVLTITEQVHVVKELQKLIIGKKGKVIEDIRLLSGAIIQVPRLEEQKEDITLIGTPEQVRIARNEIKKIVEAYHRREEQEEIRTSKTEQLYKHYQSEIDKHIKMRIQYIEESKKAYERGDKALAHELSEKAKNEAQLLEDVQIRGANTIFISRNEQFGTYQTIDLHGLHVNDALNFLAARIALLQEHFQPSIVLTVITGAGIHSENHGAKIKPAVENYLRERNIQFTENSRGSFLVSIPIK